MNKGDFPVFEFSLVEDFVIAVVEAADKGKVGSLAFDAQFFFKLSDDRFQGLVSGINMAS